MIRVFDNCFIDDNCHSLWGFSLYLREYKLLFDTGSNGRVLLKNMENLDIDISEIEYIFITHSHWDHIGGLDSIIELNSNITLFVPASLSKHLVKDLRTLVKEVIVCGKKPQKLFKNLYTTGLLGDEMPEQSLIIDDEIETKLLTGCGHFQVNNITKISKDILGKNIDFVAGGFHLLKSTEDEIINVANELKEIGVKKVLPTHCTGDKATEILNKFFM